MLFEGCFSACISNQGTDKEQEATKHDTSTPTRPSVRLQQSPSSRLFTFKNVDGSTPRVDLGKFTDLSGNEWQGPDAFEMSGFCGDGVYERDGKKYRGQFVDSMPSGAGEAWDSKNKKYDGQFQKGRRHGKGVMTYTDGKSFIYGLLVERPLYYMHICSCSHLQERVEATLGSSKVVCIPFLR
jgi:hypothetical protein